MSRLAVAVVVVIAGVGCAPSSRPQCSITEGTAAVRVTPDCVDSEFSRPIVDHEDEVTEPVAFHEVAGHFEGTDVKFTFSLPPRAQWQGRFFQSVYPLDDESATDRTLRFGAASGAYTVQTNSTAGYRADAAAAVFSRTIAARYYETSRRIYGYVWGGSGGSYQTIAAMENTVGVWDGGVPFIVGDQTSIPNNFFIRVLARMVLGNKASGIADAVAPGASEDPDLRLTPVQTQVLEEITALGMPRRAWEDPGYVLGEQSPDHLLGFAAQLKTMDPTYVSDFWSAPGYLGTEDSALGAWMRAARLDYRATVIGRAPRLDGQSVVVALDSMPATSYGDVVEVSVTGGPDSPATLTGTIDAARRTVEVSGSATDLQALQPGTQLRIDNSWYLALAAYPRYQVPTRSGFDAYDQYRQPDGMPRYPQRPTLAGATISQAVSGGGTHTGAITGKVIAVSNLLDADAFPWHADWYSRQVRSALGAEYDDSFRLWFTDHADHIAPGRTPRLIDYTGILEQALRDVAAWAENGRAPAPSTHYDVKHGQLTIPSSAAERHGLQPIVDLTAQGYRRLSTTVGQPLQLEAAITVPPDSGVVVEIAWNDTGVGHFEPDQLFDAVRPSHIVTYPAPGTYFPSLRVVVQRDADALTQFARIETLGRMRIVVRP